MSGRVTAPAPRTSQSTSIQISADDSIVRLHRGFSIAAAGGLKPHGIAVTLVGPAAVKPDMLEQQRGDANAALTFTGKRALTPEEVSEAILGPVLKHRPIEYFLPRSDEFLGKFSNVFPKTFLKLAARAKKKGEKNFESKKY